MLIKPMFIVHCYIPKTAYFAMYFVIISLLSLSNTIVITVMMFHISDGLLT